MIFRFFFFFFQRLLRAYIPCVSGPAAASGEQAVRQGGEVPLQLREFFGLHIWLRADEGRSKQGPGGRGVARTNHQEALTTIPEVHQLL